MTAPKEKVAVSPRAGQVLVAALIVSGFAGGTASAQPRTVPVAPALSPASGPPAGQSQPQLIAMMPFDGKDTPTPPKRPLQPITTADAVSEMLLARAQARYYKVLGADLWAGMARLKQHGHASEIRPIARLIKASIIIGGWLEATPGPDAPKPYRLTLTLYDEQGQLLGQLGYDVDKPVLNPAKLGGQATALFQMIDQALHVPAVAPAQVATSRPMGSPPAMAYTEPQPTAQPSWQTASQSPPMPLPEGEVAQLEDKEAVPLGPVGPLVPNSREASEIFDRRPPWLAAFDLRVGYIYGTRQFTNVGSELRLPRAGANGAVLHGELYPFSFGKNIGAALAGLGVRVTAQLPVWSDIGQATQVDTPPTGYYSVTEHRVEAALRWQYNYWAEILRPILELEGLFGNHSFTLSPKQNIDIGRLPSSEYRYLGALIGGRLFFTRKASARLGFTFAKLLSLGALATAAFDGVGQPLLQTNGYRSYGPGDGLLWRLELGASYDVWKGITLGAGFYYEQNKLSFTGQGNILQTGRLTPVTSAQDEYMGIMLTLGYIFRPSTR